VTQRHRNLAPSQPPRHLPFTPPAAWPPIVSVANGHAPPPTYVGNTAGQAPILAFIEDNWLGGQRVSSTSYDNLAGLLNDMSSWDHPDFGPFVLNPATGEVAGS
jgi:hypothetical protein